MSTVERDANLFVLYRAGADGSREYHDPHTGTLVWDRTQPGVVWVLGRFEPIPLTIEAVTTGLGEHYTEQAGTATVWPAKCHAERDWWLVDTERVQVTVYAGTVGAFLADVAWYACLNGVRLPAREWESEQLRPSFRADGGAL